MPKTRFLTAMEVAELLKLNTETIYSLIAKGDMPAVRIGKQWRFEKGELDGWLNQQTVNRQAVDMTLAANAR